MGKLFEGLQLDRCHLIEAILEPRRIFDIDLGPLDVHRPIKKDIEPILILLESLLPLPLLAALPMSPEQVEARRESEHQFLQGSERLHEVGQDLETAIGLEITS